MKKARITAFIMAVLILTLLCLSSCSAIGKVIEDQIAEIIEENAVQHTILCTAMLEDFTSGNEIDTHLGDGISDEDKTAIKSELTSVLDGADSYKLRAVGWYENTVNGYSTKTVTFELTAENGRLASIEMTMDADTNELVNVTVNDVTEFASKQNTFKLINVIFKVVSVIFVAFAAWMLIDCVKRDVKLKPLWIFVILAGILFSVSAGNKGVNANVTVGIVLSLSDFDFSLLEERIDINVLLPIGAVVYFFARKRLPIKPPEDEGEQTLDVEQLLSEEDTASNSSDKADENRTTEDQ